MLRLIVLVGTLCISTAALAADRSLLLVTGEQTTFESFSHAELRKIYLGVPVSRNELRARPVLNSSDSLALDIFLQRILFMSERDYRRQLLLRVFQRGGSRPREFNSQDKLIEHLQSEDGTLTFMWSDQFDRSSGLKSLGELWIETGN